MQNEDPVSEVKVRVKVVENRGPSVLVEYQEKAGEKGEKVTLKRCVVPFAAVDEDGKVDAGILELGVPYGIPWESVIVLSATPEALAEALRANGIWTYSDIEANPNAVLGAIQAVYGVDLGRLVQAARNYKP